MADPDLSAAEYAEIRALLTEHVFIDDCVLIRSSLDAVDDGQGGFEEDTSLLEIPFKCKSAPQMSGGMQGASETVANALEEGEMPWTIERAYLPPGDPLMPRRQDRIRHNEKTVEVIMPVPSKTRQFKTRILCKYRAAT